MNFFHKWIQKIKRQEEPKSFGQYKKDPPSLPNDQKSGKDVEARITYQYPKGQFRPEGEVQQKRTNRPRRTENRNYERRRSLTQEKNQESIEPVQEKVKHRVEVKKGPKKPFAPTEIPSPIYGFRDRREKDRHIDFPYRSLSVQPPIETHPVDTYEKGFFTKILEDDLQSNDNIDVEPLTIANEEGIEADRIENEMDSQHEDANLPSLSEMLSEPDEEAGIDHESMMVEETEELDSFVSLERPEEQVDSPSEEIVEGPENVLNEANIHKQEELMGSVSDVSYLSQESEDETSIPVKTETNRPHLPFNVVMLKQDKQKWETAKQQESVQKITNETESVRKENVKKPYIFPSQRLLTPPADETDQGEWIQSQADILNQTLKHFHVKARVVACSQGPSVTRFEVQPEPGVKVNKITNLMDDLKLSLAAKDIRMEAPIPGKHTIGIEIPNQMARPVHLRELTEHPKFQNDTSPLTVALGLDISGEPIMTDLKKMPHGLIAGATGSGKSVCINSILVSLMYKADPEHVKLLLIDPKMVELTPYNGVPHLVAPVITDVKAATTSLKWAVQEMESRYDEFAKTGVRDIERYNKLYPENFLPYVVIIIDELADLMMVAPADVEDAICRIAQKARACGIHLIIATQRPSVDVITGLIKANVPTRIAFSVSSQVDSRTIIDTSGAERLLGKGDMLFLENGASKPVRLQGTFVSDVEIDSVVQHVSMQKEPDYLFHQEELLQKAQIEDEEDELFIEACQFVVEQGNASTSLLQRRFRVGYNRAARLMEMMEAQGIVSEAKGTKPRDVLITEDGLQSFSDPQE